MTFGVSETGIAQVNANTSAVWYAGMLGEFMRHPEVEIFSPWSWQVGMWEVLHLYSRYNKTHYAKATSSDETSVSAYPTINQSGDSITVVLVNRASSSKTATVNFSGFNLASQSFDVLKLSNLTSSETFVSHQTNALQKSTITPSQNALNVTLPAMSVTSILLKGAKGEVVTGIDEKDAREIMNLYPNPVEESRTVTIEIRKSGTASLELMDVTGQRLKHFFHGKKVTNAFSQKLELSEFSPGTYLLKLQMDDRIYYRKIIVAQ